LDVPSIFQQRLAAGAVISIALVSWQATSGHMRMPTIWPLSASTPICR